MDNKVCKLLMIVISIVVIIGILAFAVCGEADAFNYQLFDTTYKFDEAYISMPDGTFIKGKVDSWVDYEDSDAVQVKINGITYYTHLNNVVLIAN